MHDSVFSTRVSPLEKVELAVVGSFSHDYLYNPRFGAREVTGGAGGYVSLAAASLGVNVGIFGILPKAIPDDIVKIIQTRLDCSGLSQMPGADITFNIKYDDHWNPEYHVDSTEAENRIPFEDFPESYKRARVVHLCPTTDVARQLDFVAGVKRNMSAILSATTFKHRITTQRESVISLLQTVDFFFLNLEEALLLTLRDEAELAYRDLEQIAQGKVICVTLGAKGVIVFAENTRYILPAYSTRLKDPTGAGESFAGGFAAAYLKYQNSLDSAIAGLCISSFAIEEWGVEALLQLRSEDVEYRMFEYREKYYRVRG